MRRIALVTALAFIVASCGRAAAPGGRIVVAHLAAKTVDVYDGTTFKREARIPIPGGAHAVDVQPDGSRVWTANIDVDSVSVVDVAGRRVVATVAVCDGPTQVAFAAQLKRAYVACGDGYMSVIDTTSLKALAREAIGFGPHAFVAGPRGHLWTANRGGNDLSEVDPASNKLLERIPAAPHAYGLAFSQDGKYAFVTSRKWHSVVVVSMDDTQILGAIKVGTDPGVVIASRDGERVYVSNRGDGTVSVVNALTFQVLDSIRVGGEPDGMALSDDGRLLLVANHASDTVSVVDVSGGNVLRTITTSDGPVDVKLVG